MGDLLGILSKTNMIYLYTLWSKISLTCIYDSLPLHASYILHRSLFEPFICPCHPSFGKEWAHVHQQRGGCIKDDALTITAKQIMCSDAWVHLLVCFLIRISSIFGCTCTLDSTKFWPLPKVPNQWVHLTSFFLEPGSISWAIHLGLIWNALLSIYVPDLKCHACCMWLFQKLKKIKRVIVVGYVVCWSPAKFHKNVTRRKRGMT
jgi:hypothetical protein